MDIVKPKDIERPEFADVPYDYRNQEKAGRYRGVGKTGKVGKMGSSMDKNPMPPEKHVMGVPRDHEG